MSIAKPSNCVLIGLFSIFSGIVGDHKSHLDPEFSLAFDQWVSKNLAAAGKPDFKFKYAIKLNNTFEPAVESEGSGESPEKEV